jgi:hypothetical protein
VFLLEESEQQGRSWWFYFVSRFSLFAIHCFCEVVCWFRIRRLRWIIGGGWLFVRWDCVLDEGLFCCICEGGIS